MVKAMSAVNVLSMTKHNQETLRRYAVKELFSILCSQLELSLSVISMAKSRSLVWNSSQRCSYRRMEVHGGIK